MGNNIENYSFLKCKSSSSSTAKYFCLLDYFKLNIKLFTLFVEVLIHFKLQVFLFYWQIIMLLTRTKSLQIEITYLLKNHPLTIPSLKWLKYLKKNKCHYIQDIFTSYFFFLQCNNTNKNENKHKNYKNLLKVNKT